MPDNPPETIPFRVSLLERELAEQKARHERDINTLVTRFEREAHELEIALAALKDRADTRERSALIWGIFALGGVLTTVLGVLWANLGAIFPGRG